MRRTVLVTGSQGFVGNQLRAALRARDVDVLGVDLPNSGAEEGLDLSRPDLDAEALARRTGPVHGIIHLAARITRGSSVDEPARANLVTIAESPVRLWEAYHQVHGPTHLVFCSTFKTYGPAPDQLIDPARPPQRPDPHSYGSAKALAERLLTIASKRLDSSFCIVRPTCIYGPGQHLHNAIPVFLRACLDGKAPTVFGNGTSFRDDVLASDLAYCLAEASLRRRSGSFHAGGEKGRSILEVAELCCQAVEQLGGVAGLRPTLDPSRPPKWWLDQAFDISATIRELDYSPTPLLEGLKREAAWIRAGASPETSLAFAAGELR